MYIPGLFRIASTPSSSWIDWAVYSDEASGFVTADLSPEPDEGDVFG
jgi:hypothetical protein